MGILQAVTLRRGVGKADTEYAPQMVTWLNQEGWKDAGAGEAGKLSPADIEAAQKRVDAARRRNEERDRQMVEQRRRDLGMVNVRAITRKPTYRRVLRRQHLVACSSGGIR
jgi:hypothetical protein